MNQQPKQLTNNRRYQKLKTELAICQIGGLFLALYQDENVPELIISKLQKDLPNYFQFSVPMTEKKVWFPIFFEQTFEQVGKQSNIYHVLGIEVLPEKSQADFLQYLQYGRERFKALPYSIVFWMHPPFAKELFHAAPDFHHWVFGTYDFTGINPDVINQNEDKRLAFHKDAEAAFLNNINHYLEKLIWQYENWQIVKDSDVEFLVEVMGRANLHDYYVNLYCTDKNRKVWLLDELLDTFLANDKQSFMTLLGDFGTGKSSFALHYFIVQAQHYLLDNSRRIPIFVSLKDYPGKLNLETFITQEFYKKLGLSLSLATFQALVLQGQFLFFIDGFDEMAAMSDEQETIENFKELTKLSFENIQFVTQSEDRKPSNKVFMTCRTHYFLTNAQEQNILKADKTILYRNYATKNEYQVTRINLRKFNQAQIGKYVLKSVGDKKTAEQILNIIKDTYNLEELSTRPLLLEMIVKTLPELKDQKQINAADLYKAYTDMWIGRDDWRSQMTSQGKRAFMGELAVKMYQEGGDFSLHYSHLDQPKEAFLKQHLDSLEKDYYKYEATTCSFLNRDLSGNYKFIHKSFMEYFLAECFFCGMKGKNLSSLKKINEEVIFFIKMITFINEKKLNVDLSEMILNQGDLKEASLEGAKFVRANLEGANLEGANLEGANFEGATLINATLIGATLINATLVGAKLKGADIQWANLEKANLYRANLHGANLHGANLQEANLQSANLEEANLEGANLEGAYIVGAYLQGTNLEGANF